MSSINPDLIFNFNINDCFELSKHLMYFQALTNITQAFADPNKGVIGFRYNNSKVPGGLLLKMATIPGEVYHLFAVGQVVIGNVITIRIMNPCPEINITEPMHWRMGCEEVRSTWFKALGHQTNLMITTDIHCFCNLAPYNFLLSCLNIIPDVLMCQGFIRGTDGPIGVTGPIGLIGQIGPPGGFNSGNIGPPGAQGPQGNPGESGDPGITGRIGTFGSSGLLGPQGTQFGLQGEIGTIGLNGGVGVIGDQGARGPTGPTGAQGPAAYILNENVFISYANVAWYRGGSAKVALNVPLVYQIIDNMVLLRISSFVSVGSFDGVNPIFSCLSSETLPADIRTAIDTSLSPDDPDSSQQSFFPCIVEVGNASVQVPQEAIIEIGPLTITIYSDMQFSCDFDPTQVVLFPTQTFVYYKN